MARARCVCVWMGVGGLSVSVLREKWGGVPGVSVGECVVCWLSPPLHREAVEGDEDVEDHEVVVLD
eukprot:4715414-Prorocentrum_lima.AAC.1